MTQQHNRKHFVICVQNDGYDVSLEKRKIYEVVEDADAQKHNQLRVIDESGEDYLFPQNLFIEIALPKSTEEALIEAA